MNRTLKSKQAKICAQTRMIWVPALPIALLGVRNEVNRSSGFTRYELTHGLQFPGPAVGGVSGREVFALKHKPYLDQLLGIITGFSKQAQLGDQTKEGTPHVSEWVQLKAIKRKWSELRWRGPYQVVECSTCTVRLKGKGDTWFHWINCVPAAEPSRALKEIRRPQQDKGQREKRVRSSCFSFILNSFFSFIEFKYSSVQYNHSCFSFIINSFFQFN